jgi:sugar phosphate isomerase/epimerase
LKRRHFLKTSSAFAATSMLAFTPTIGATKKSIGVQVYTVRKEINKDLVGTLKKVADIGYTSIELAGYRDGKFYGKAPSEFKQIANDLGLKVLSSHNGIKPELFEKIVEDNVSVGVDYTVLPYLGNTQRKTLDDYKKLADSFNTYGETCKKAGIKFAYHNHAFEFDIMDDKIPFDVLLEGTDPDLVKFELDLYWVKKAGKDPLDYFNKYPGRFAMWHVKDMDPTSGKYTEVGSGDINFKEIFENASKSGMQYLFVELDNSERPALESIKISYDYLNRSEFVQ